MQPPVDALSDDSLNLAQLSMEAISIMLRPSFLQHDDCFSFLPSSLICHQHRCVQQIPCHFFLQGNSILTCADIYIFLQSQSKNDHLESSSLELNAFTLIAFLHFHAEGGGRQAHHFRLYHLWGLLQRASLHFVFL